jgi:hypothetical protein
MNYLLGEREQLGYLERRDDPDDKRSRRIELTERGYAVCRIMRISVADIDADLERDMGRAALEQLRQLSIALHSSRAIESRPASPVSSPNLIRQVWVSVARA